MTKMRLTAAVCMMALVMGVLGPVQMVEAAGCAAGRHPETRARDLAESNPAPIHHPVYSGYYVDGKPIYQICKAYVVYITGGNFCTSCGAKVSSYSYPIETHPLANDPNHD